VEFRDIDTGAIKRVGILPAIAGGVDGFRACRATSGRAGGVWRVAQRLNQRT
jgi:hypothetical protein